LRDERLLKDFRGTTALHRQMAVHSAGAGPKGRYPVSITGDPDASYCPVARGSVRALRGEFDPVRILPCTWRQLSVNPCAGLLVLFDV